MAPDADPRTTPPPPPAGTGPRKLVRRPDEGPFAGVCAGVAEYLHVDPNIVRIATAVLAVTGPGIPAYLLAWVFVPAADGSVLIEGFPKQPNDKRTQIIGIALIALALSVFWGGWWAPARHWLVPFGLIGVGAWMLLRPERDDDGPVPPPPVPPTQPGPAWSAPTPTSVVPAPPAPAGATEASTPHDPPRTDDMATTTDDPTTTDAPGGEPPTEELSDPTDPATSVFAPGAVHWRPTPEGGGDGGGSGGDTTTVASDSPPPAHRYSGPRRRRILGPLVFGALLLWGGIAWLTGVDVQDGLAIGLCLLGLGFVLGAFIGGSKALVFPALLVGAALVTTSVVDIPWGGGIGDKRWDPRDLGELPDSYELGIGDATLDLRDLALASGDHPDVQVDVGIGHLTVLVPDGIGLEVRGEVGAGQLDLLDRTDDGVGVDLERSIAPTSGRGTIDLDLHIGFGHLEVRESGEAADTPTPEIATTTVPTVPVNAVA